MWTLIEYYFHRIILHRELVMDKSKEDGKRNAKYFMSHIQHHVFMN